MKSIMDKIVRRELLFFFLEFITITDHLQFHTNWNVIDIVNNLSIWQPILSVLHNNSPHFVEQCLSSWIVYWPRVNSGFMLMKFSAFVPRQVAWMLWHVKFITEVFFFSTTNIWTKAKCDETFYFVLCNFHV